MTLIRIKNHSQIQRVDNNAKVDLSLVRNPKQSIQVTKVRLGSYQGDSNPGSRGQLGYLP